MVRSLSKRESLTHWWNFTSSSSTDLFLLPETRSGASRVTLGLRSVLHPTIPTGCFLLQVCRGGPGLSGSGGDLTQKPRVWLPPQPSVFYFHFIFLKILAETFFLIFLFLFFEIGSNIALVVLKFHTQTRMASKSQRSAHLFIPGARIKHMSHHAQHKF